MTPGRRTLRYDSLDQVMPDVERLLQGHTTSGNWSLAEICRHLAKSMRLAVDMPASTKHDPSLQFSPEIVAQVFDTGQLLEGLPLPAVLAAADPIEERQAAELLREAIAYYAASTGPVAGHRYLGPLSKAQWDHLQRIHCAHHLSFAKPIAE
jgi:hypothetical protein